MRLFLLFMFAGICMVGNAQSILSPANNSFENKWVKNTRYKMAWYIVKDTANIEIGNVTTQISVNNKTLTLVTGVSMKNAKSPWVDSSIANAKTLQPLRHASYNMQRDMVLNFGKVVTGFYNDKIKNSNTIISDTTSSNYFDSNLYPLLIGWLHLDNNYKQDISIYDYNPSAKIGVLKASVKQVISGVYPSDKSGIRNVWIVTVTDEIANGANDSSVYYFDKTDRRLWKQEINISGRKMMMKLIE